MSYLESLGEIQYRIGMGAPKPRPTTYKGVKFRSRLELKFAWHLDLLDEQWVYEPRVYGPRGRRYLPDFEIIGALRPTFIEIKPTLREVPKAKWKMTVIWDTHPDALLIVACQEALTWFGCTRGGRWREWQDRWAA